MLSERSRSQPPLRRLSDDLYALNERNDFGMSIIFFHGPCNDGEDIANMYFRDWVSICQNASGDEVLWPMAWLAEDLPGAQIFFASYDLSLKVASRNWREDCYLIGENLLASIFLHAQEYEMWSKPVILVGHSLGGIVIKELLLKAHHSLRAGSSVFNGRVKQFLDNIILIYYYSTPHYGMRLRVEGDSNGPLSPVCGNARTNNAYLSGLQKEFRQLSSLYRNWRKATIGESLMIKWDLMGIYDALVPEASWRGDDCDSSMIADADHFSVCKPTSKTCNIYTDLLSQIEACKYDLKIADHVRDAVARLIFFREVSLNKLPSLDPASLVDLKERLKNGPVEFKTQLFDSPGFLQDLVRLLSEEGRHKAWDADGRIRATTAYIIYYLAREKKLRAQIGLYPEALERLLKLLHMKVGEVLKAALYALHVLARDGPSAAAICRREGALDQLVFLMDSQEDADVRVKAATTLAFATDKLRGNMNSFLDRERACIVLVRMLEEKQIPNLQYSAAHALANVPEYYSELAKQPQALLTLAILLLGNRSGESGESGEQNDGEMVQRLKVATIFEGITADGANALQIATCPGVLENMLRVLEVTEDNPVQLQLSVVRSLHDIANVHSNLEERENLSMSIKTVTDLICLIRERDDRDVRYYASSVCAALLRNEKVIEEIRGNKENLDTLIAGLDSCLDVPNLEQRTTDHLLFCKHTLSPSS
ncbi:hypothetical protein AXG93_1502s1330 [Marchantia polymorpha subsp. ruderalis]|uniref:Protein SERAC1 n=1 Tax=Marchantia polymorpha subsp. ruderalis TaxID=1480154 RepID=A0A176WEL2_MARPO|nr:hypothetical protein AXG93_1502s1330 [Marchantia polymorpha subsp. ruderalis]